MSLVNVHRFTLPNGETYDLEGDYTSGDTAGVTALSVAAGISCISTGTLLILLILSANRRFQAPGQVVFIRTHVAPYFLSLLFCDFWQSIGSLLSVHWVSNGRVFLGSTCTAQAAIKNGGNVGTAIWSLAIALHTFFVLFVGRRPWEPALYFTLILCWCLIGLIVIIGPVALENIATRGPYFGVSGLWCWITDQYSLPQLMLEYMWMFASAFINVILYLLIWLKLRGNLVVDGWHWRLRRAQGKTWDPTTGQTSLQAQVTSITRHMMMFPIVYFLVVMPIAGCRYALWAGYDVPFQLIIFADVIFILQGFINVVLFCCTRSVIPADHQNLFGVSSISGGSTRTRVKGVPSSDDEESSMSMEPVTMQFEPQAKPQRIQRINHIISIEPARAASPTPSRPSGSRQHSRADSQGNTYESQGSSYQNPAGGSGNPAQWVSYSSVPSTSASPRLTAQELGKINAQSRTPPPQQLVVQRAAPLPGVPRAPSPRPRTPLRVINATETIGSMVDVDLHDEPEEMPHTARPFMYGHNRAASSSASSVSSYMTDDSSAPLTATPARSKDSHARRESGLAFERYSDHRSHSPVPILPLHPFASSHSRSASYSSTYEHHMPPPISTNYQASSSGSITQNQMMGVPMVTVQAASPMSPPRNVPEPISLEAARRAPPSNVPDTARPPTPLSRNSHDGSADSHAAGAGGSIYL